MTKQKKRRYTKKNQELLELVKFLVKFNLFAIPLYIILFTGWTFVQLQQLTVDLSYQILVITGAEPAVSDFLISIPIKNGNWAAFINWDCTGWKSMIAFFALIMSTPFTMRKKMYGLLLIPLIYVINLVRIFFMFLYVRTFDLANYQLVHSVVWSWGLILAILLLWVLWLRTNGFERLEKTIYSALHK